MKYKLERPSDGARVGSRAAIGTEGPNCAYSDLREWIAEAKKFGEVRTVTGASWEKDIGVVAELVLRDSNAPCIVFDEVPGYPKGFRVLINFFGGKRMNMTMGFPTHLSKLELSNMHLKYQVDGLPTIPYEVVNSGPVVDNVLEGDEVDVTMFPTPLWHEKDGGRYFGTGCFIVTKDPDSEWINVGCYRVMIHNGKQVGIYISPGKHGRMHRDKYEERGEPMPVVVVAGGDPMTFLAAASEFPPGMCEYDIVGGMRRKALEVVKGKHTGLPFPAHAEIAIEGFIEPGKRLMEGPFGEWTGYYASDEREEPVMDIRAIYHRDDPIILGCPPQRPPDELARYRAVIRSALLRNNIRKAGVPEVKSVWTHEVGGARMLVGVAIEQRYPGHSRQAGHIAAQCHVGAYAGKYVVVVDEDIDVSNLDELIWAMLTRSDPASSFDIIPEAWSTPLDPRIAPEDKAKGNYRNSRAIIDACRPFHWRREFPPVNAMSADAAKKAREKWGYLLE
ncbi:MAG: UbiD family decarboxylase [Alphaproteobacteria bacterium]|jgi:4-hydroxy-3-polyprenylbenzoate decarboxylase|nr:UbiD family decarboxylase [Alphaproteobacteria bacterium]